MAMHLSPDVRNVRRVALLTVLSCISTNKCLVYKLYLKIYGLTMDVIIV